MSADNKTAATTATADASDTTDKPDKPDKLDELDKPQPGGPADQQARLIAASAAKHATLRYATLRIVIFIVSLGVLWGVVAATGHVVHRQRRAVRRWARCWSPARRRSSCCRGSGTRCRRRSGSLAVTGRSSYRGEASGGERLACWGGSEDLIRRT